jgi:predicted signal transduction protein with EAL and GGDEF domain
MKILIADDDAMSRRLTQKTLQNAGYEVLAVDNGLSAVESLAISNGPRLALLDWLMPGLDGPSVCRQTRGQFDRPYVYMILLSSKESKEDIVAGLEAGADDYLVKPCDPEELKARLRAGERILELQDKLVHDARHDPLTHLPNRALFLETLSQSIKQAKRGIDYKFAILFVDLDHFKDVNDKFGHAIGDEFIVEVAKRLATSIRRDNTDQSSVAAIMGSKRVHGNDLLARFGGDEFTILLDNISDASDAIRVAERIQQKLASTLVIAEHELLTSTSIGIAVSISGYSAAEDMLRDADTAMYRAKAAGKSRYEICDPAMHNKAVQRLSLENDLSKAIERDELRVYYQPIVLLEDFRICGFEALVRWQRQDSGLVQPGEFISVAEETGLILPIGNWVLREACRQMRLWHLQFPSAPTFTVAVNVSATQFVNPGLISQVEHVLRDTSLEPGNLKLELTESVAMKGVGETIEILNGLQAVGVRVSIDDFGTGYSSLSYLHRFKFDTLKIDRSFICRMDQSTESRQIVQTIVTLAHSMGMEVVAEGVETTEELKRLREFACEYAQGYLFSKPVPKEEVTQILLRSSVNSHKLSIERETELASNLD